MGFYDGTSRSIGSITALSYHVFVRQLAMHVFLEVVGTAWQAENRRLDIDTEYSDNRRLQTVATVYTPFAHRLIFSVSIKHL